MPSLIATVTAHPVLSCFWQQQ